jgi:nucleotide-binding universal stress UspA family protein
MNTDLIQGSVVAGVDVSSGSDTALAWAVAQATARHRPLVIAHGAGHPHARSRIHGVAEARRTGRMESRRVTEGALRRVRRLSPELDVHVVEPATDAAAALMGLADRAALIVVGTRDRGPARSLVLGSVGATVAAHAGCPVVVVRPAAPAGGYEHVVVGVDDGASSVAALEFAFELAASEQRRLDIVHTWSSDDAFVDEYSAGLRAERRDAHARLLAEVTSGFTEKYPEVGHETRLIDGGAVATLVGLSATASTVVVGSRGRTGLGGALGSVSRAVLGRAHCTVAVVKP